MSKKAAILFTGFARHYKETSNLFFSRFIDCNPHWDIDIYLNFQPYVCSWKNSIERSYLDLEDLKKTFNTDYLNIYEVDEKEVEKKYLDINNINLPKSHKNINFIKYGIICQYYGWHQAINNLDNKNYDLVFKMRTDIASKENVNFDDLDPNNITYFKRATDSFGIDDIVFCSKQANMDKIMSIYNYLSLNNLQSLSTCFPEYILEKYCKELNIIKQQGPKLTNLYK